MYDTGFNYENLVRNSQNSDYKQETRVQDYNDYNDGNECSCSCRNCEDPEKCCEPFCSNCNTQGMANIVLIPYPYPLILSLNSQWNSTMKYVKTNETNPTSETTENTFATPSHEINNTIPPISSITVPTFTTMSTVQTTKTNPTISANPVTQTPSEPSLRAINRSNKSKYLLTTARRTMPVWVPKYGIVPIPDNLAKKLMVKLRQMKELQNF